jgi:hypothetical protein
MPEWLTRTWAASRRNSGRLRLGTVGGFMSVRWAASRRYLHAGVRRAMAYIGRRQSTGLRESNTKHIELASRSHLRRIAKLAILRTRPARTVRLAVGRP